jgi:DNA-directed RNA polymerase subunit RPC12/RpoP
MNPYLKKICRERAISTDPGSWQTNGMSGDKCPNCGSSIFSSQGWNMPYRCFDCDKLFEREGWRGWKEVESNDVKETGDKKL